MCFLNFLLCRFYWLLFFCCIQPYQIFAETKTWTGFGGDAKWSNPLNWSGITVPQATDDVWLDNSEMPVSYQVALPDTAVIVRILHIQPSPGRSIELILPATNKITNAFTATGPGYGIELDAGAIFRNASGLSSGESLSISDSLIIHDGARYIHQTRASHANGILKILSLAPGTEQGIFDFDVPRASYTISVSNRVYGSLELHATALGSAVNYTCSGANPLLVRGNLRIGQSVSMSINLSGSNGNVQVAGDFIQEGGQLNLAAGTGDQTILRIKGDLYQSSSAVITATTNDTPYLELNGIKKQEIAMAGLIHNQVGFRLNNVEGAELRLPLKLPWNLSLVEGVLVSSGTALLTLDSDCTVLADSSRLSGTYVDGPIHKLGLNSSSHFLFPTGKAGYLRWLALNQASGNFTVEYFRNDPATIGTNLSSGLNHTSKLEYWTVDADSPDAGNAIIELSFASIQCGGITDPQFLNVAKFVDASWQDAGHSSITGNAIQGSVSSESEDFTAHAYTLASTVNLENPLPVTKINLKVRQVSENVVFSWSFDGPETPNHFEIVELVDSEFKRIAEISAAPLLVNYSWACDSPFFNGSHYFRINMIDDHGQVYNSEITLFYMKNDVIRLSWPRAGSGVNGTQLLIQTNSPDHWNYEILSINGGQVAKGIVQLIEGDNLVRVIPENLARGYYVFHAAASDGKIYSLLFVKDFD